MDWLKNTVKGIASSDGGGSSKISERERESSFHRDDVALANGLASHMATRLHKEDATKMPPPPPPLKDSPSVAGIRWKRLEGRVRLTGDGGYEEKVEARKRRRPLKKGSGWIRRCGRRGLSVTIRASYKRSKSPKRGKRKDASIQSTPEAAVAEAGNRATAVEASRAAGGMGPGGSARKRREQRWQKAGSQCPIGCCYCCCCRWKRNQL